MRSLVDMLNVINHRNEPIESGSTALLIIDVQNGTYNIEEEKKMAYFYKKATKETIPNIKKLIDSARDSNIEVIYTTIESLTKDGRDRSLDYKISGFNFPKGCWESKVIDEISPQEDEIVIPKTSSSLFNSTNFDYILKNIGIKQIIVTGFLTDQCIDHTIRDGADRGYLMICASDGCATESLNREENALNAFGGYCRIATTNELIEEMIRKNNKI